MYNHYNHTKLRIFPNIPRILIKTEKRGLRIDIVPQTS